MNESKNVINKIKNTKYDKELIKVIWNRDKITKKFKSFDFYLVINNKWEYIETVKDYDIMKQITKNLNFKEIWHDENFN